MKKPRVLSHIGVSDMLPKVPLVELAGQGRVLIENHLGVLAYSLEEIQIKVAYGKLCVTGKELTLMQMNSDQLVIKGSIDTLQLFRR